MSDSDADRRAAAAMDAIQNGIYMDPVLLGRVPAIRTVVGAPMDRSCVLDGDLDVISAPIDVLGINYYNPTLVKAPGEGNPFPFEITAMEGYETTDMGWPVVPDGLRELLVGVQARYGDALPPVMITENGAAFPDVLVEAPEGDVAHVDDPRRVEYLRSHIAAVARGPRRGRRRHAATSCGRSWTTSSGPRATRSASGSSTSTTRPSGASRSCRTRWYRAFLGGEA